MKKGLIGKKLGMTHVYDSNGVMVPVTVIELGPCPVLAVKTQDKDGYSAIQLGFGVRKEKNVTKALKGNFKKAGIETDLPALIKEVRLDSDPEVKVGD
ncbi:MAG: 50S ribosomal protein L3, partial [Victivallales bacterium]|nr:50S ribosomal protein L3 [Victivallales bacterium]